MAFITAFLNIGGHGFMKSLGIKRCSPLIASFCSVITASLYIKKKQPDLIYVYMFYTFMLAK